MYCANKLFTSVIVSVFSIIILLSSAANGLTTYAVTDATTARCGGGSPHGLWTNAENFTGSTCGNFFSIERGMLSIEDMNTSANLRAVASNARYDSNGDKIGVEGIDWISAEIDLLFSDWADTDRKSDGIPGNSINYKKEGGLDYDPANVDFFTMVTGTIKIGDEVFYIDDMVGDYAFQYGLGASAKSKDAFGASAWVQTAACSDSTNSFCADNDYQAMTSHHWDLNLNLTETPLPASLLLFGTGLIGLGMIKRNTKKA